MDDEGSIKGLPRNLRASEIAHCCGKPLEVGWGCNNMLHEIGGARRAAGRLHEAWAARSMRCTLHTRTIGAPPPQVKGDAFLARVMDNGDDFERLDLCLDEVSSGAPWVQQARQQNERKRQVRRRCRPFCSGSVLVLHATEAQHVTGTTHPVFVAQAASPTGQIRCCSADARRKAAMRC